MTDEDALRLLMNILGEQQRYQEAHDCYRQTCEMREQAGEPIDPRTHDLAEYWRTKHARPPAKSFPQPSLVPPSPPSSLVAYENVIQFLQVIQAVLPRTVPNGKVSSEAPESDAALIIVLPTPESSPQMASFDLATWLSDRANKLRALGTSGPPMSSQKRQATVYTEIESWNRMVDQDHPQTKAFLSTRRAVLAGLILVSDGVLKWVQSGRMTPVIAKEFLVQCATSLTACHHLLKGDGLAAVEYALPQYLPHLIALAKAPSSFQKEAAYLAAQACCLIGVVKSHRRQFHESVAHRKQAVELAEVTGDSVLLAAAFVQLGTAWFYSDRPEKTLEACQKAERLIPKDPPFFPAHLQSRIYIDLSNAYACTGHLQEAKNYRDLANAIELLPDDNLFIPCLDYDLSHKIVMEGKVSIQLGRLKAPDPNQSLSEEARTIYENADAVLGQLSPESDSVTERVIIEGTILRSLVAVKLGNMEKSIEYLRKGALGAKSLGSDRQKRRPKVY